MTFTNTNNPLSYGLGGMKPKPSFNAQPLRAPSSTYNSEVDVVDTGLTAIRLILESRLKGLEAEVESIKKQLKSLEMVKVEAPRPQVAEISTPSIPIATESTEIMIPDNFQLTDL